MKIFNIFKTIYDSPVEKGKAISQAMGCKGWTNELKLSLLYDLAQQANNLDGDILEIGSAWGRSTVLLALATNKKIWSIDPHTGGVAFIRRGEEQDSFKEFQYNLQKNKVDTRVNAIVSTTLGVEKNAMIPNDVIFSMAFIDGLHTADGVIVDFNFAYSRLVKNGIIAFDDYFEPTVLDYKDMLDLLVNAKNISLIKDFDSKLVYVYKK